MAGIEASDVKVALVRVPTAVTLSPDRGDRVGAVGRELGPDAEDADQLGLALGLGRGALALDQRGLDGDLLAVAVAAPS